MERLFMYIYCEGTRLGSNNHVVVKHRLVINDSVYRPQNMLIVNPVYADPILRIGDPTECIFIGDIRLAQKDQNSPTTCNYFCLN